jgi:hypothetical protein
VPGQSKGAPSRCKTAPIAAAARRVRQTARSSAACASPAHVVQAKTRKTARSAGPGAPPSSTDPHAFRRSARPTSGTRSTRGCFAWRQGEALFPTREPFDTLEHIRHTVGEYNFAGQYPASLGTAWRWGGQGRVVCDEASRPSPCAERGSHLSFPQGAGAVSLAIAPLWGCSSRTGPHPLSLSQTVAASDHRCCLSIGIGTRACNRSTLAIEAPNMRSLLAARQRRLQCPHR